MQQFKRKLLAPWRRLSPTHIREAFIYTWYGGFFEVPKSDATYLAQQAESYNATRETTASWQAENKAMEYFLGKLPPNMTVFDMPFGTGRYIDYYLARGHEVYGMDRSEHMLSNAQETLGANFAKCKLSLGDARRFPFTDRMFDLVVCSRFLPHIIDFQTACLAMAEISRVTGKFAIIQLGERPEKARRLRKPRPNEKMGTWLYPEEIKDFLAGYGFNLVEKSEALHAGVTIGRHFYKNPPGWRFYLCEKT